MEKVSVDKNKIFKMEILIFFILIFSQDSLIYGSHELMRYPQENVLIMLRYAAFLLFIFYCVFIQNNGKLKYQKNLYVFWVILLLFITASMGINFDFEGVYIVVSLVISFLVVCSHTWELYYRAFRNVIKRISVISLVVHFLFIIFYEPMNILSIGLKNEMNLICQILSRFLEKCWDPYLHCNAAIFRERGVFCLYILIALLVVFYEDRKITKNNVFEIGVLLVSIITTKGSSGIVSLVILLAGYVVYVFRRKKIIKWLVMLVPIVLLVGSPYLVENFRLIILKFDKTSYLGDSGITRMTSMIVPFQVMLRNPLFGVGAGNFNLLFQKIVPSIEGMKSTAFTNTILGIGAYYGIIPVLLVVVGLLAFCKKICNGKVHWLFAFASLLLNFFCQNEICMSVFWCMVLYGIVSSNEVKA